MTDYFFRDGTPVTTEVRVGTKATTPVLKVCGRCGGAGGAEKWKPTGWTCFDCGGKGNLGYRPVTVYTAEKLAKLNTAKAKRDAIKQAQRDTKAAAEKARADAEREAFMTRHADLIAEMREYAPKSEFIADVLNRVLEQVRISDNQITAITNAIYRIKRETERRAAAKHLGAIGERITLSGLTVFFWRRIDVQAPNGYSPYGPSYLTVLRTIEGSTVVYKGKFVAEKGSIVDVVATVTEHNEFRGEPQTKINRPKWTIVEAAKPESDFDR